MNTKYLMIPFLFLFLWISPQASVAGELEEIDFFKFYSDEAQMISEFDPDMITIVQNVETDWGKLGLKGYPKKVIQTEEFTDRKRVRTFHFNIRGRLVKYEEYDSKQKSPKRTIDYKYDTSNRLIKITYKKATEVVNKSIQYSGSKLVGATYHSNGLVATYGRNKYMFTYNENGQIIKFDNQNITNEGVRSYDYDSQGKCKKEEYTRSLTATNIRNKNDQTKAVIRHIHKYSYDSEGYIMLINRRDSKGEGQMTLFTTFRNDFMIYSYDDCNNWIDKWKTTREYEYYTKSELSDVIEVSAKKPEAENEENFTTHTVINEIKKDYTIIRKSVTSRSFYSGDGSLETPYLITTPEELAYLAELVNGGNSLEGKYFMLVNDLDLGANNSEKLTWEPIGSNRDKPFGGIFIGIGHTIYNMETNNNIGDEFGAGLFGVLSKSAIITDIKIDKSCSIKGNYSGGIAGVNKGTIHECSSNATVEGNDTGGIAGINEGSIFDCASGAYLNIPSYTAGGIAAKNSGTILRCSFTGKIQHLMVTKYCGGIAGEMLINGRISDSYNRGDISATTFSLSTKTGGITGTKDFEEGNEAVIRNCYSAGTGKGAHLMPEYKKNKQHVSDCYFDVDIKGLSKSEKKERDWYFQNGAKTSVEMKSIDMVNLLNKNKKTQYWMQDIEGINDGYPILGQVQLSESNDQTTVVQKKTRTTISIVKIIKSVISITEEHIIDCPTDSTSIPEKQNDTNPEKQNDTNPEKPETTAQEDAKDSPVLCNPESGTRRFPFKTNDPVKPEHTNKATPPDKPLNGTEVKDAETTIKEDTQTDPSGPLDEVVRFTSFPQKVKFRELCDLGYWKILEIRCIGRTTDSSNKGYRFVIKVVGLKDSNGLSGTYRSLAIAHANKGSFDIKKKYVGSFYFPKTKEGEVAEFEIANLFDSYPNPEFAGFVIYKSRMGAPYEIYNPHNSRWKVVTQ